MLVGLGTVSGEQAVPIFLGIRPKVTAMMWHYLAIGLALTGLAGALWLDPSVQARVREYRKTKELSSCELPEEVERPIPAVVPLSETRD